MAEYLIKDTTLTDIGNAIREKTEKTGSILVANFAEEIRNISSGAELNFDVIAYATESQMLTAKPKENTIGIVTDTDITGWYFGVDAPTISNGLIWISTDISSTVEFNALKKNGILVYPISAKQYVSGAWVDVTAKSYQNGQWVEWVKILIKDGVITDFAKKYDGFKTKGLGLRADNPGAKEPTVTIEDGYVRLSLSANNNSYYGGVYYLGEKIDLTNVNKVEVDMEVEVWGTASSHVGIWSNFGNYSCDNRVATAYLQLDSVAATVSGRETLTIDTSELKGEYFVGVHLLTAPSGYTQNTTKIYDMLME